MKNILKCVTSCMMMFMLISCASKSTYNLMFEAEKPINDGVLLPVDVIVAKDPTMNAVLKIGPEEWFGHQTREVLVDRELHSLAINGGETRKKKVVAEKDVSRIIIYADYENSSNRSDQQLIINCSDWKKSYEILIKENRLEMAK